MTRAAFTLLAALLLGLSLAACADAGDEAADDPTSAATAGSASVGDLDLTDVRARAVPAETGRSAIYLTITNGGDQDDELLVASAAADIAGAVELHETVAMEDSSDDMDGMSDMAEATQDDEMEGMGGMTMRQVPSIVVPAGEETVLEPGGLHVMLLEVPGALEAGTSFDITLDFAKAGAVTVEAPVVANP